MKTALRYFASIIAVMAALTLIFASCAMNWLFWSGQGQSEIEKQLFGGVSVSFDVMKALLPGLVVSAFTARKFIYSALGSTAFVLFLVAALISSIGFVAGSRGGVSGTQVSKNSSLEIATAEAKELEKRISRYPKILPSPQLNAQMQKLRTNRRWGTTKECSDATASKSRTFCANYLDVKGQFAAAIALENDRAKLADVRQEIRHLRSIGAGNEANIQAVYIARFAPDISKSDAEFAITIFFAVLIEIGAAFGLFLALNHWPSNEKNSNGTSNTFSDNQVTVIDMKPVNRTSSTLPVQIKPPPLQAGLTDEDIAAFDAINWRRSSSCH